jgi:hypothetical protein
MHLSPQHRLALRLLHLSHLPRLYHLPVLQCSRVAPCSAEPFSCDVSSPSSASVAAPLPDSSPAVTATDLIVRFPLFIIQEFSPLYRISLDVTSSIKLVCVQHIESDIEKAKHRFPRKTDFLSFPRILLLS